MTILHSQAWVNRIAKRIPSYVPVIFCLWLGCLPAALTAIPLPEDPQIRTLLGSIEEAGEPQVLDGYLLLTYTSDPSPRFLGAAFSHENFSRVHSFVRNEEGVYLLLFPIPEWISELQYRLVIDGLWTLDPGNPRKMIDPFGHRVSAVPVPQSIKEIRKSPVVRSGGYVEFRYYGPESARVSVAGDFNNWDPFSHQMSETRPGEYVATIRIKSGTHFYQFIANGTTMSDPLNPERIDSTTGGTISMFTAP